MSMLRSAAGLLLVAASSIANAATADLQVTKTTPSTGAAPGELIVYTITVHNNGPDAATNVSITDTLSERVRFEDIDTPLSCTTPVQFAGTGTVHCTSPTLAAGATEVLTVQVRVAVDAAGGTIENSATAVSQTNDPNTTNSSASAAPVPVLPPSADVGIGKFTQWTVAPTGTIIEYTLFIRNDGPSTATNIVVTDTLPAGLELVSAKMIGGTCAGTTTITCSQGGSLIRGQPGEATVRARVTATSGTITNTASVSAAQSDPKPSNNNAISRTLPVISVGIPTMSAWALIALGLAMAGFAVTRMK